MGKDNYEITLHKNLRKSLRDSNQFEMEPVKEREELALIEEEKGSIIEIEVNYEVNPLESNKEMVDVDFKAIDDNVEKIQEEVSEEKIEDLKIEIKQLKEKIMSLKDEKESLVLNNRKLKAILTQEQKVVFYRDNCENDNLTRTERMLLDKREELQRRSEIRRKGWFQIMLTSRI